MPGILKAIKGGNAHACRNLESYLNQDEKVKNDERIGINCDAETFNDDFRLERAKHLIDNSARAYVHYTLSYRETDGLSHQEILEQAKKLVEGIDKFKGHQVAIICHSDKNHPHCHIVVNAVHSETGRKLSLYKNDLREAKEILIGLDKEKGLGVEVKTHKGIRNQSMKAYKMAEKGEKGDKKVWKVAIKNAVIENIGKSVSKDDFIKRMEKQGFSVEWTEKKQNITITDSEGNKRRLSNIEKEYPEYEGKLNKESLEQTFEYNSIVLESTGNEEISKELASFSKSEEKEQPISKSNVKGTEQEQSSSSEWGIEDDDGEGGGGSTFSSSKKKNPWGIKINSDKGWER